MDERDLILDPLRRDEIAALVEEVGGIEAILSKKSPKYKEWVPKMATPEEWITAMAEEPRLIRRPIWRHGSHIVVGFSGASWEKLIEQ